MPPARDTSRCRRTSPKRHDRRARDRACRCQSHLRSLDTSAATQYSIHKGCRRELTRNVHEDGCGYPRYYASIRIVTCIAKEHPDAHISISQQYPPTQGVSDHTQFFGLFLQETYAMRLWQRPGAIGSMALLVEHRPFGSGITNLAAPAKQ